MTVTRKHFQVLVAAVGAFVLLGFLAPAALALLFDMPLDTALLCCIYLAVLACVLLVLALPFVIIRGIHHAKARDADG